MFKNKKESIVCKVNKKFEDGVLHMELEELPKYLKGKFREIRFQKDGLLGKLNVQIFTEKDDAIKTIKAPHCTIFAPSDLDQGEALDVFHYCLGFFQGRHVGDKKHWIHKY